MIDEILFVLNVISVAAEVAIIILEKICEATELINNL
jgi:hypothetical protein